MKIDDNRFGKIQEGLGQARFGLVQASCFQRAKDDPIDLVLPLEVPSFPYVLVELQARLQVAAGRNIGMRSEKLSNLASLLESVNYKKILARGFALVKNQQGNLVTTAAQAKNSESLNIIFSDGEITAKI